jgi:hypothetical protein
LDGSENLSHLDQRFVDIYEAARAKMVERQKQEALIVIQDDSLLLFRHDRTMERFPGLMPPLYNKMKTLGHMPLGAFCLLHDHMDGELPEVVLAEVESYRAAIEGAADALDMHEEAKAGILPEPSQIYPKVTAFLDAVITERSISKSELDMFAQSVAGDIGPVLAAAARAQLDACNEIVTHIRKELLTPAQWAELRVIVLGPYMARQGELFLQYFAEVLNTPQQGDRRVVYFDGDDLTGAFDRLGTTMLDAVASHAIFGERDRLHRDVLADATTRYLKSLASAACDP